jgi:hypothetical protein
LDELLLRLDEPLRLRLEELPLLLRPEELRPEELRPDELRLEELRLLDDEPERLDELERDFEPLEPLLLEPLRLDPLDLLAPLRDGVRDRCCDPRLPPPLCC